MSIISYRGFNSRTQLGTLIEVKFDFISSAKSLFFSKDQVHHQI